MIVVNNKETSLESKATHKDFYVDMFRKELDAYCAYKEMSEETEDKMLEMALEEIMMDEYLHAKFLREYMIDKGMYDLPDSDPHEKKFWKIQRKIFREY